MTACKFDRPVAIFLGLGFPRDIESVLDAYDLLLGWHGIPDPDHRTAVDVCAKALNGLRTVEEAHEAFKRFAHNRGILAEEAIDRTARTFAEEWQRPRA